MQRALPPTRFFNGCVWLCFVAGGGSGHVRVFRNLKLDKSEYAVVVGAEGQGTLTDEDGHGTDGGDSRFGDLEVNGGKGAKPNTGGSDHAALLR